MKLREELAYPADVETVFSMLCDPAFRRRVCEATYALDHSVSVESQGDVVIISVVRVMPADVPPVVRRVVGDRIEISQVERWAAAAQYGQRTADLALTVVGQPARMSGTIALTAVDGATRGTVEGELRVNVPIFGGRLASEMANGFRFALSVEAEVAKEYLAG
jgi:hypothetical protein